MNANKNKFILNKLPLDILTIVASLDPSTGGPARSVPNLGEAIKSNGTNVQLFTNDTEIQTTQNHESIPSTLPIKKLKRLAETARNLQINKQSLPLIHNHGIWLSANHSAAVVARRYNIPLIISPRGMLEPWAFNYNKWKKNIAWFLYQNRDLHTARVFHATAMQEAENLRQLGLQAPIAVIPNGVHLPKEIKLRPIKNKTKKALFLSRIHPIKGLINLVQAWATVSPSNWKVIIAGPDEVNHKSDIEKEIERLGLTDFFSFTGPIQDNDKWALYNDADLFILPTFSENFGIVIAEALGSGLPVITTRGTPWADLTQHKCGWWIDIGVKPLVEAIREATSLSREIRHEMGCRGRSLVIEKYSWETIAQDMVSVYEWVLHGGRLPQCILTN